MAGRKIKSNNNDAKDVKVDNLEMYNYHVFFSWGIDDKGGHKIIEFLKYTSDDVRKEISSDILHNCENQEESQTPTLISDMKKQIIEFKIKSVYKQASVHFFHSKEDWDVEKLQKYLDEDELRRLRTIEGSQIAI